MARSPTRFAQLLSEAVHRIRLRESKRTSIVQEELGAELGRGGGSAVEYWRKGHIPFHQSEIEALARQLVRRGHLEREWLRVFLDSAEYAQPDDLIDDLFPAAAPVYEAQPRALPHAPSDEFDTFVVGPPVLYPRQFFGREHEMKRLFGLLRRFPLQNAAIVGQERSGKTSLLHYLRAICLAFPEQLRPGQSNNWLPQPARYQWVFVDFQDARMCSRDGLLRHILAGLSLPVPGHCTLSAFMDIMSDGLSAPAVILMDEIGAGMQSAELDQQFWWSLRSLGSNLTGGNLSFILTSHQQPDHLARDLGKPSPFFNIFGHMIQLGPLSQPSARELIASSPRPFAADAVDWILDQSQCWPALLQILCDTHLSALEDGQAGPAWRDDALRRMEPFRYLLNPR